MKRQSADFITIVKNGVVSKVGKSYVNTPEVKFKGGKINWYDDSRLLKKNK